MSFFAKINYFSKSRRGAIVGAFLPRPIAGEPYLEKIFTITKLQTCYCKALVE